MTPDTVDAVLLSWPADPWLWLGLAVTAALYLRGWLVFRRRDPGRWPVARPAAFLGGLFAVFLALASPVEPFAGLLLQVHMVQHLLLTMLAPPLLWLGWPFLPMVRGLPAPIRSVWLPPILGNPALKRFAATLTHPISAWLIFVGVTVGWHVPGAYELALRSPNWHYAQHVCFLGAGLLFWYPVVRPYPARPAWSEWLLVPYLLLADVANTVLSAVLTFADRPLYPYYTEVPRLGGVSALDDQSAAGVLMWVPGSLAFLVPCVAHGTRLMFGHPLPAAKKPAARIALPLAQANPPERFDLLRVPGLGRFLRWRYARPTLQLPLLLLAIVMAYDGFTGPEVAPMNLAGVLPWVHWRGLLVFGLLIGGNFFCTACPFTLTRWAAREYLPGRWAWPRRLRNKWLAVALTGAFLWAYEALALWDDPRATAGLVFAYFTAAFLIDALFRGGTFCKYVCPIGQFNFVQSLASPLEVAVRDPAVCGRCETKDCVRGRDGILGCETGLFLPRKAGNLDCTFCLDCARACPHGNIGVLPVAPGKRLWDGSSGSGIGAMARRPDVAALVLLLTFGAFANAAGMTGPVVEALDAVRAHFGTSAAWPVTTAFYLLALVAAPLVVSSTAAVLGKHSAGLWGSVSTIAVRYALTLAPVGFGMWLSHYSFHLLTSYEAVVPVVQRAAGGLLGSPEWGCACCKPPGEWLLRLELVSLGGGLLLSLYAMFRVAVADAVGRWLGAFWPWAAVAVMLYAVGVWVVFQPMEMRGTLPG